MYSCRTAESAKGSKTQKGDFQPDRAKDDPAASRFDRLVAASDGDAFHAAIVERMLVDVGAGVR